LKPPEGLDATGRAAFRHAVAVLEELGEDPRLSVRTIGAYAAAESEAETLTREWRRLGASGIRRGPRGGVFEEPLLRAIDRAARRAADLAGDLGLSPAARRQLSRNVGRPAGAASAPDRAGPPPMRTLRSVG
jgi:P27 family predicted phage terminase small subunit